MGGDEGRHGKVGVHLALISSPDGLRSEYPTAGRPVLVPETACKIQPRTTTNHQTSDSKPEEIRSWPHLFMKELKGQRKRAINIGL